jgi:cysteinyl-tRNA synthetase
MGELMRIGIGYDIHRLVEGRPLILGGVRLPSEKGLLGHSDADAVLHAVADAMLGAAALGDIGRYFPDTDPHFKDVESAKILSTVVSMVRDRGWLVENVDINIIAQFPKLAPHMPAMQNRIAEVLNVTPEQVGLKARTKEKLGAVGRGEAVEVQAVVLLSSPEEEVEKKRLRSAKEGEEEMEVTATLETKPIYMYNTLSRKKEEFKPIVDGKVGMYVCGITAYDSCHLGHARAALSFDVVYRYLRHRGFDVTFVRNYTDVDDKIINRANSEGRDCEDISKQYIKEYQEDMADLEVAKPSIEPRATEHIEDMIATIEKLIERGYAYPTESGVYFSVRKFNGYGKLSGKKIEDLESGARVEVDEKKQDPLDFALWKASKPGEPMWDSPWGPGRPGWHIECSAMSSRYLGQPFDIHGGGRDLVFPHHENEVAQAEGAEGKQFVNYWLHNGFININAEKMSKSLGNITTIRSILDRYDHEVVRYFLIASHYRSPIDYTSQAMEESKTGLDRFYETALRAHRIHPGKGGGVPDADSPEAEELKEKLLDFDRKFDDAMNDDFNTAEAIGVGFDLVRSFNRYLDAIGTSQTPFSGWAVLQFMHVQHVLGEVLGVFGSDPTDYQRRTKEKGTATAGVDADRVEKLIEERKTARKSKDFKRADEIRAKLDSLGVELKDRPDGATEWKMK